METRASRMRRVADSIKALEAARDKRRQRALEAVRDRKTAAAPAPGKQPRRNPRAEVKLAAAVIGAGGRAVYGWVRNVATAGCYVACPETWPPGTPCSVRLTLPPEAGGGTLELPARVARADAEGMGLAFADPDPEAVQALARLVEAYDATLG